MSTTDRDAAMISQQGTEPILQFFAFDHLRPELQNVSEPFSNLAHQIVVTLPRNPERTVALRESLVLLGVAGDPLIERRQVASALESA